MRCGRRSRPVSRCLWTITPPAGTGARISDRVCLVGMLTRLVTGCSWVTAERLLDYEVSDTTLRARRDEWVEAGVFDALAGEALDAYDRIVGLGPVRNSRRRVPAQGAVWGAPAPDQTPLTGGNAAGSGPYCATGRASRWAGPPTARTATTASCSNPPSAPPATAACSATSRPCTSIAAMTTAASAPAPPPRESTTWFAPAGARREPAQTATPVPLGQRWAIERTNSWLSNFGQLRRNTDPSDPSTDSPNSPWPSPYSSAPNSSTGATAGTPPHEQSAHALSLNPPLGVVGGGFGGVGDGLSRRSGGSGRLDGRFGPVGGVGGAWGPGRGWFGARGAGGGPLRSG